MKIISWIIRTATPKDAEQIVSVRIASWKDGYKWLIDQWHLDSLIVTQERIEKMRLMLGENKGIFLVYEEDGNVLWFLHWWDCRDEDPSYPAEIYAFYVEPSQQKKWIWTKLFNEFLVRSANTSVCLWTLPGSKWAAFYQKIWWLQDGEKDAEIKGKIYKEVRYCRKR